MKDYITHPDVRVLGSNSYGYGLALNVKWYGRDDCMGGTEHQRERAYNRAKARWWDSARIAAQEAGFDNAYSCGCSGGYIYPVLNNRRAVTVADVCLDPGEYGSDEADRIVGMLRNFRAYIREATAPDHLQKMFTDELQRVIAESKADEDEAAREESERADTFAMAVRELKAAGFHDIASRLEKYA